ncbi:MAG: GGDEF domain-containing protein [Planktotalea sp.]|uniref:diguanylate cyclase domain-containing protein n=1 Tax=Planktotalea sp. TaxID=2029877 RepID=UPI003C766D96
MKVDRQFSRPSVLEWDALEGALDILCPMNLRLTETGHIIHAAPTLQKMRAGSDLVGKRFLEVFRLDRPRSIATMSELMNLERSKLHMEFRDAPNTALKGVLVRLPKGQGALVNLSFGISVVEGVQDYGLTSSDFAATDLAIEMLYLVEAKSAAMEASRKLNQRLQGAKLAAEQQAATDTLTGLQNRRAADRILEHHTSDRRGFALMHLDLDFFKSVNDTKGHAAGDFVLQEVAKVMRAETRKCDTIARVGGDEFMILIDGETSKEVLSDIAARLIAGIEVPILFEGAECRISASIGIALHYTNSDIGADALVQNSDQALYASKAKGRACATFFDDIAAGPG